MYKITARMAQNLESDLERYHELFDGGRCSGWELEELIVRAIRSDTTAQHHPRWTEAGHDDETDILVRTNGVEHMIQVKSGKIQSDHLILSGHRLGRFDGNFNDISDYLNNAKANIMAVTYEQTDDDTGRHHCYTICYVPVQVLQQADPNSWDLQGKQYQQITKDGVVYSLRPSMSWQIWWKVPLNMIETDKKMIIT